MGVPGKCPKPKLRRARLGQDGFRDSELVSGEQVGVGAGLQAFDRWTGGLRAGEVTIIAGGPGIGKTALALHLARQVAISDKLPVALITPGKRTADLANVLLAAQAVVPLERIETGRVLDSDWPLLARAADALYPAPMYLESSTGPSLLDLRFTCRRIKARHANLAIVIVDDVHLLAPDEDYRRCAAALNSLSNELTVAVVALVPLPLRTGLEFRRPVFAQLGPLQPLALSAKVVAFLHATAEPPRDPSVPRSVELIVARNAGGPIGTGDLTFRADCGRWE